MYHVYMKNTITIKVSLQEFKLLLIWTLLGCMKDDEAVDWGYLTSNEVKVLRDAMTIIKRLITIKLTRQEFLLLRICTQESPKRPTVGRGGGGG